MSATPGGTRRFYRLDVNGTPRHVIEEDGRWRLLEGDLFGRFEAGAEIARDGHALLSPVTPSNKVSGAGELTNSARGERP
jgi:hypothetical protein